MTPDDLIFKDGRTVVKIDEHTFLSIITPDRNDFIRAAKEWSPSAILHGWTITDAECDGETTWEIAFIDARQKSLDEVVPDFYDYSFFDDGWIIYREVPIEKVMDYINAHEGVMATEDQEGYLS